MTSHTLRTTDTSHLQARDLLVLEGLLGRDYDRPGTWTLVIRFPSQMYVIDEFPDATHFVERIRKHNPYVEIRGVWPMGPP